jgi:nucleobase:cation symporter-1, NCS1 family
VRAVVACGWFGINAWIGGEALQTFFASLFRGWPTLLGAVPLAGHLPTVWVSFLIFWGLNIVVIYRGMDLLRKVENWAAPYVLVMAAILLGWAIWRAHGLGPIVEAKPARAPGAFVKIFVPSLTAMIGFWATLSLNMPDFTRFGRSQRAQMVGQVVALPTTMTLFAAMSVLITSATTVIFGEVLWEPVQLVSKFQSRLVVAIAMFTVVVATLSVNIAANVVSPANDLANLAPKKISFRTGGLITGVVGILMMPWRLLADPNGYIFQWLLGYSGGLGSIAGVLIADYWLLRRAHLSLADLYRRDGIYRYGALGTNWNAVVATAVGCTLAWIGLVVPALRPLYDYAWFVGGGVSALVYVVSMRVSPPARTQESVA